jgi:hypothetical protein
MCIYCHSEPTGRDCVVNVWAWDKVKLGLGFTTKKAQDPKTRNKVTITNGFSKCQVQFKPSTPLSLSLGGGGGGGILIKKKQNQKIF